MLFFKNKNKISRHQRVAVYQGAKKRGGFSFRVPIVKGKNLPARYANDFYGRPAKQIYFSYIKVFLSVLVIAALLYVAFFSSIFKIKKITVVNNQVLLESDIVKFLEDRNIKNKNLFLVNSGQIQDVLKGYYKRIEDVRVYRVLPDQIRIKIKESSSNLIWQSGVRRYLIDNSGVVIGEAQEDNKDKIPVVVDETALPVQMGSKIITSSFIDFVNIVDESLKKRFGIDVINYSINQTTAELKVNTAKKFYLIFDTTPDTDAATQLDKLAMILNQGEKITEYVILSINGRIIVK